MNGIALIVKFSDTMVEPAYLPRPGTQKGDWLMSIDGVSYATAPGTPCGLTGDWTTYALAGSMVDPGAHDDMIGETFTSLVGSALMDGKALWIHGATPSTVVFSTFGVLKNITPARTVSFVDKRWSFLKEIKNPNPVKAQVQLSLLVEVRHE